MTVLPARLTTVAPAGAFTPAPTFVMRPLVTTIVPFSIGARPVPSTMRAPVKAIVPVAGTCASGAAYMNAAMRRAMGTRYRRVTSGRTLMPRPSLSNIRP
jgi:hypothetical protein